MVANIASFLRFAADWQRGQPARDAGRVRRLPRRLPGGRRRAADERRADRGRRWRPADDAVPGEGPRVPDRLRPAAARRASGRRARAGAGYFPRELLREAVPEGDLHTEEERRLLYVAMTRAQERLILTTHGGPRRDEGAVAVRRRARLGRWRRRPGRRPDGRGRCGLATVTVTAAELDADRRRRAAGHAAADRPRAPARAAPPGERARRADGSDAPRRIRRRRPRATAFERASWRTPVAPPRWRADEARAQGLDPLTFRTIALDTGAGANLLDVAPLPGAFSYSAFDTYERCPLQYAFKYVYRIPEPARAGAGVDASGRRPTPRSRRSPRSAASAPRAASRRRPARTSSASSAHAGCRPAFGDRATEEALRAAGRRRCSTTSGRARSRRSARRCHEELDFELRLGPRSGAGPRWSSAARSTASTGCRRAASRSSTTRPATCHRRRASTRACSCRSTRWPAATRWASARRSG